MTSFALANIGIIFFCFQRVKRFKLLLLTKIMIKIIGASLIILGAILFYGAWGNENYSMFLFQISVGPAFIFLGYQLLK